MPRKPGDPVILPMPPRIPIDDGGIVWPGGTPYFDERTGRYIYPVPQPPVDYPVDPGQPRIQPWPYPPQFGDPGQGPVRPGTPVPIQPSPENPPLRYWLGGDPITWSPTASVQADKVKRRMAASRNG